MSLHSNHAFRYLQCSSKEKGKFEIKYPCVCLQLTVVATHDWIGGNRKGIDIFRFLHLLLLTEHGRQTSFMWPWLSDNSEIMKKVFLAAML